jgi:hypothetical protein
MSATALDVGHRREPTLDLAARDSVYFGDHERQ